ncbi:hypothetical protein N7462_005859 [Penicillium macrosclerotiorum]|uniref:uncharacterized protein n=1 Tax=Penicillium macrosclerotiorum TaxID=303699 RepID=UPI0025495A7C|nr:uncharacterized protein N7462_005859 [Penicillium macrosclerotiorum]KAJ5682694.1 hypothetical protein N7462_005859 [Penicillium macrosclerotiorum]
MDDPSPMIKRRRLDTATALSRPFKSPLHRPKSLGVSSQPTPLTPETGKFSQHRTDIITLPARPNDDTDISTPVSVCPPEERPQKATCRTSLTTSIRSSQVDPELRDLQKQERALQSQLATLRQELDTIKQALRIESSTKDAELEALIMKWRLVSQEAADEVFTGARERASRIGGLTAWKEYNRHNIYAQGFEDHDTEHIDEQDRGDDETGDSYELSKASKRAEHVTEEEFTMNFMLKALNIEPVVIGYDPVLGKWIRD